MFGSKLRAWMDAVRPKKKQHRKDKQGKHATSKSERPTTNNHNVSWQNNCLLDTEQKNISRGGKYANKATINSDRHNANAGDLQMSRYSATNLSSPESAYSTGYSTDGTSPGGAPANYPIKVSEKKSAEIRSSCEQKWHNPGVPINCYPEPAQCSSLGAVPEHDKPRLDERDEREPNPSTSATFFTKVPEPAGLVSPRQRNRIRTNPWLPGGSPTAVASPLPVREEVKITPISYRKIRNSPIQHRYLSPATRRRSLSSSSCSSLSAGPTHSFEHKFPKSFSDEDDCTLNEMMGKYDESYVYEKETDILSDSDPTDCESDIDTGQDGGDEEDNGDEELDFIDNGSYVEVDSRINNTGHCLYLIPADPNQRKRSSRRRTARRAKESNERRRRSNSSKKIQRHASEKTRHSSLHQDGSKSAGATPLLIRRSNTKSSQYRIPEELIKKRSNSVCLQRDIANVIIDKRDREADMKYKELIGQAEQIIRTMNVNGLSPRRLPGPTNKRVELLRCAESAKSEGKPADDALIPNSNPPSATTTFKNSRFSPKKNHITNFIISNSPVLVKKELPVQAPSPFMVRKIFAEDSHHSPPHTVVVRRPSQQINEDLYKKANKPMKQHCEVGFASSAFPRRSPKPRSIVHVTEATPLHMLSPRRRVGHELSSSEEEEEKIQKYKKKLSKSCPQSEPVRRKVYFGRSTMNFAKNHGKTVVFNLQKEVPNPNVGFESKIGSSENLRHHVLLNTIQSLKRNLEDHSASLQNTYTYTYRSTQNVFN